MSASGAASTASAPEAALAVMGEKVEQAVAERLLAAVMPEQIKLALQAADTVTDRRSRQTRAVELRVERARYDAARAERAFHQCDPERRLVARTLQARWETKLRELQDAEAELARHATQQPLPARADIEALARDLPRLWAAPTTSHRDRKRLLRALIADVTLTFEPDSPEIKIGIRWQSGASEQLTVLRPQAARSARAQAVFGATASSADPHQPAARRTPQPDRLAHRFRPPIHRRQRPLDALEAPHPLPAEATRRPDRRARPRPTPRRRRRRHLPVDQPRQAPSEACRPTQARDHVQRRDRCRLPQPHRELHPNQETNAINCCRRCSMKTPSPRRSAPGRRSEPRRGARRRRERRCRRPVPRDPHQPASPRLAHPLREERHHVLDLARVRRAGPAVDCLIAYSAVQAAQPSQPALQRAPIHAQFKVPPAPCGSRRSSGAGLSARTPSTRGGGAWAAERHDHALPPRS